MNNWIASFRLPTLDRFIRLFLFPVSVLFAVGALLLSITTFSDIQQASISSAFATVQSVEEAFLRESAYPNSVVLSAQDRNLEQYWVVSGDGIVLASSDTTLIGTALEATVWEATDRSVNGEILDDYSLAGSSSVIAGAMDPSGEFWTFVKLSPEDSLSSVIWLILAILALSLISVTGLIASRFLHNESGEKGGTDAPRTSEPTAGMDLSNWEVGGDGAPALLHRTSEREAMTLHEAILKALDDFVLVLDQDRQLVYSNPAIHLSEIEQMVELDGISAFADRFLDDKARTRFERWLEAGSVSKNLILDVRDDSGALHQTRWMAHALSMKSGASYDVFVGQRTLIEEFPLASL